MIVNSTECMLCCRLYAEKIRKFAEKFATSHSESTCKVSLEAWMHERKKKNEGHGFTFEGKAANHDNFIKKIHSFHSTQERKSKVYKKQKQNKTKTKPKTKAGLITIQQQTQSLHPALMTCSVTITHNITATTNSYWTHLQRASKTTITTTNSSSCRCTMATTTSTTNDCWLITFSTITYK